MQDVASSEDQLRVHMKTQPQHGRLELQGTALLEGDSFSLQDLKALRVRYEYEKLEITFVRLKIWAGKSRFRIDEDRIDEDNYNLLKITIHSIF